MAKLLRARCVPLHLCRRAKQGTALLWPAAKAGSIVRLPGSLLTLISPSFPHCRRAKEGTAPLSPEAKLAAWEELRAAAFTRAAGAALLLPLLDAFVRVQHNIRGPHL